MAVVLMHGYLFGRHERAVGRIAREVGFTQVSLSHEVMPMMRCARRVRVPRARARE